MLVLDGVNVVIGLINDIVQGRRIQEALAAEEPRIARMRRDDSGNGVLIVVHYRHVENESRESPIHPVNNFEYLEFATGKTQEEARAQVAGRTWMSSGDPKVSFPYEEIWLPPVKAPKVSELSVPFPTVARATFAGKPARTDVWYDGEAFHTYGEIPLAVPEGVTPQFLILKPPKSIGREDIPVSERSASSGESLPVVELKGLPFTHETAVFVFPADEETNRILQQGPAVFVSAFFPNELANMSLVRWIAPQKIRVLKATDR
jgi:hypothetical protein